MEYADFEDEWQQRTDGWTSFIPGGAIISKPMNIFNKNVRIGERSCITKEKVSTNSTMTADYIHITDAKETQINAICEIGGKQMVSESKIKGDTTIETPPECSIISAELKCGRVNYQSKNKEVGQIRIRRVAITTSPGIKEVTSDYTNYIIGGAISICLIMAILAMVKKWCVIRVGTCFGFFSPMMIMISIMTIK